MVKYVKGKNETKISKKRLEVMKLFRKHQVRVEVYTDKNLFANNSFINNSRIPVLDNII